MVRLSYDGAEEDLLSSASAPSSALASSALASPAGRRKAPMDCGLYLEERRRWRSVEAIGPRLRDLEARLEFLSISAGAAASSPVIPFPLEDEGLSSTAAFAREAEKEIAAAATRADAAARRAEAISLATDREERKDRLVREEEEEQQQRVARERRAAEQEALVARRAREDYDDTAQQQQQQQWEAADRAARLKQEEEGNAQARRLKNAEKAAPQEAAPKEEEDGLNDDEDAETRAAVAVIEAAARVRASAEKAAALPGLKRVCVALKKLVGGTINAVGNEAPSARLAAAKLAAAIEDPMEGLKLHASAARYLTAEDGTAVQDARGKASALVLDHAAQRLVEKLLADSFNYRKDVWSLAVVSADLCRAVPAARAIFQNRLLETDAAVARAKPRTEVPSVQAEKVAALIAALAVVDPSSDSPLGGLGAAWTWCARYANHAFNTDLATAAKALPSFVAFVETAGFALFRAFGDHFAKLLAALDAQVLRHLRTNAGLEPETIRAATKLGNFLDQARANKLQEPEGFANFKEP